MHILITGVAGFIGFNLAKSLLKNHKIFGIDNYDDYYSIELKKKRIYELKKNKNFFFKEIDINNFNSVQNNFSLLNQLFVDNLEIFSPPGSSLVPGLRRPRYVARQAFCDWRSKNPKN